MPAHARSAQQTSAKRETFFCGFKDYRPAPHEFVQVLRSRKDSPFDDRNVVRDEVRRTALDGTDEEITLQFVMQRASLRWDKLNAFFAYYKVNSTVRNVVGGLN